MCAIENNIIEATKVAILLKKVNEELSESIDKAVNKAMKQGGDK